MNNMTYEKYKDSKVVKEFINHFNLNLINKGKSHWCPRYKDRKEFQFKIKEFPESIDKYSWPSSFLVPEDSYGYFENGKEVKCESWLETKKCLQSLSKGLKKSLDLKDDGRVLQWCSAILSWGMGDGKAKKATLDKLTGLSNKGMLVSYINRIRYLHSNEVVNLIDTIQIFKKSTVFAFKEDWMSSGLSKIIALASENIIILDSRVGAILCEYINDYLNKNKKNKIPVELKFSWDNGMASKSGISVRRRPSPLENKNNHPKFKRNSSWYEQQIKASWLIRAILETNSELFKDEGGMIERIHAFEASLFMLGYNLNNTSKEEYKNITQNKSVVEVKKTNKKSDKTKVGSDKKNNTTANDIREFVIELITNNLDEADVFEFTSSKVKKEIGGDLTAICGALKITKFFNERNIAIEIIDAPSSGLGRVTYKATLMS